MPHPDLAYIDQSPPPHYRLAFEPSLYNQEDFLRLKDYPVHSFYAVDHQQQSVAARIHFTLRRQEKGGLQAISLPELPFGSLEYDPRMKQDQIADFLDFVRNKLAQRGCHTIEIRDCIPIYRSDSDNLFSSILLNSKYQIVEEMVNHHIVVDNKPFVEKIHKMEAKRLRKCNRAEFIFSQESNEKLKAVYDFLSYCRAERGWKLSMSLPQLQKVVSKFPNTYHIFSVYDENLRIAAGLLVLARRNTIYDFYHDALNSYNRYSPTAFLLSHLYSYCQSNGVSTLDLGISTTESLCGFKKRVGGILSYKKTYLLAC